MKLKLKQDDLVEIVSGNEKGKQGRILHVDREKCRVVVEGANLRKFHEKVQKDREGGQTGGIEEREAPLHISNVALVDPETKKPVRLGIKEVDGKRVRYTRGKNASGTTLE